MKIKGDALISECGQYRYLLRRTWDLNKPRLLWVMLNPSTADADVDDATIRSCIRLSKRWGAGSFEVVNLFAFRSRDPDQLKTAVDPVGKRNDEVIIDALQYCDSVICAWGAKPIARQRAQEVMSLIRQYKSVAFIIGKTASGSPRHPLFAASNTKLFSWSELS